MNDDQKTGQNKNDASNAGMQNQPQAQGVGFHNKEHGALGSPLSEVMQLSEAEPNVSEELRGIGVKANNTSFELNDEHREAGVTHASESTPFLTSPKSTGGLPATEREVKEEIKETKRTDSWFGYLLELLKNFKRVKLIEREA